MAKVNPMATVFDSMNDEAEPQQETTGTPTLEELADKVADLEQRVAELEGTEQTEDQAPMPMSGGMKPPFGG